MTVVYCSPPVVAVACRRPAGRSHMRCVVAKEAAGVVVTVIAGLWTRAVGWDGGLGVDQYSGSEGMMRDLDVCQEISQCKYRWSRGVDLRGGECAGGGLL